MNVDVSDFTKDVLELSMTIPVLVDFWAEWCGPCKVLGPVLERLASKNEGRWALRKLDTEQFPDVAATYNIRSIPNVKLFVRGEAVQEFVGALPEGAIESWLKKALPDEHQELLSTAEEQLKKGNIDEAKRLLESIVEARPTLERPRALLALQLVFEDPPRAFSLVGDIHESGPDGQLAESVRTFHRLLGYGNEPDSLPEGVGRQEYAQAVRSLASRDFDRALASFIEVIRRDRSYDEDGARKACIAVFTYLGEEHEITRRRGREFSSALFA